MKQAEPNSDPSPSDAKDNFLAVAKAHLTEASLAAEPAVKQKSGKQEIPDTAEVEDLNKPSLDQEAEESPEEGEEAADDQTDETRYDQGQLADLFGDYAEALEQAPPEVLSALVERELAIRAELDEISTQVAAQEQAYNGAIQQLQTLGDLVPRLEEALADKWAGIDWAGLRKESPQQYLELLEAYEADVATKEAVKKTKTEAERIYKQSRVAAEQQRLFELAPEFRDLKSNPHLLTDMLDVAQRFGISRDVVDNLTGPEVALLHFATQQLKAQAGLNKIRAQKPALAKATPVRGRSMGKQDAADSIFRKLAETGSGSDFAKFVRARGIV